jgi:hypothetical protein
MHEIERNKAIHENSRYLPGIKAKCFVCKNEYNNNEFFLPVDDNHNTKRCYDCCMNNYLFCSKCYKFYKTYCLCRPKKANHNTILYDWNFTPKYKCLDTEADVQIGIELEFFRDGEHIFAAEAAQILLNNPAFVLKYDGSIRNTEGEKNGIEVASHILSPRWIYNNIDVINNVLTEIRKLGYLAAINKTCGSHVHYSSSTITNKQIRNILYFFGRYPDQIRILSRRQQRTEFWKIPTDNFTIIGNAETFNSERNSYINLSNPGTVEFRFFAGTSTIERFLYLLETTMAIMDFGLNVEKKDLMNELAFRNFVEKNNQKYSYTWEYLKNVRYRL